MVELGRAQARTSAVPGPGGGVAPPRQRAEVLDVAAALERLADPRTVEPPHHRLMLLGAHDIRRLRAANAMLLALLAEGAGLWPIDEDWVYRVRTAQRELAAQGLVVPPAGG